MRLRWLVALGVVVSATVAGAETRTVVIESGRVTPTFLRTLTGQRVDFVNRSDGPVHVEFGDDRRGHHVVQVPITGPIWAVFHRPGTHPYVVHLSGGRRAVAGTVEVVEDDTHRWDSRTCGGVVMERCIEP